MKGSRSSAGGIAAARGSRGLPLRGACGRILAVGLEGGRGAAWAGLLEEKNGGSKDGFDLPFAWC